MVSEPGFFCSWGHWQTGDKGTPLRLQELLGVARVGQSWHKVGRV